MQQELHRWLADRNLRLATPGTVVQTAPHRLPFRAVLHAVAVDGFYDTSPDRVRGYVRTSLTRAAELGATRVALTTLATGYGRLRVAAFGAAVRLLRSVPFPPVSEVIVCVRSASDRDAVVASPNSRD